MIVLGIDCSTRTASVALNEDDEVVAERSLAGAGDLAATVLPLVDDVLDAARRRVDDLSLIAVALGPGSFTGLRIGLSIAKGIALATGCDVVGVSTLEALAVVARTAPGARSGLICPVLDARRGEVYGAVFRVGGDAAMVRVEADFAGTPEGLAARLEAQREAGVTCALIGDGVDAYRDRWPGLLAAPAELLPFVAFHPRGSVVAALGRARLEEHGADVVAAMVPRYCRLAEAEQKRQARLQEAAIAGR